MSLRLSFIWSIALAMLLMFTAVANAAEHTPTAVMEVGMNEVLTLLKDQKMDKQARRDKVRESIEKRFDFDVMSQSVLAQNWRKATPEQREKFVGLFQTMLENTYMTAIESYTSETVRFEKENVQGNRASVDATAVLANGTEAPMNFRLVNRGKGWAVYDVVIEGVSLISNFRSSYASIVKREGMDGLLNQMKQKVGQSS